MLVGRGRAEGSIPAATIFSPYFSRVSWNALDVIRREGLSRQTAGSTPVVS